MPGPVQLLSADLHSEDGHDVGTSDDLQGAIPPCKGPVPVCQGQACCVLQLLSVWPARTLFTEI